MINFPFFSGFVPGVFGLCGIWWGLPNLKMGKHLPMSGIVFILGCALWFFSLFYLLPWSASL